MHSETIWRGKQFHTLSGPYAASMSLSLLLVPSRDSEQRVGSDVPDLTGTDFNI